ncbi:hypothetical protein ACNS7O_09905 [Haloferacaceae archaeon DSL9]
MRLSIQYSDAVLIGILLSLVVGAVAAYATALSSAVAIPTTAVVGIALIYHTIFVRGPVDSTAELTAEAHEVTVFE